MLGRNDAAIEQTVTNTDPKYPVEERIRDAEAKLAKLRSEPRRDAAKRHRSVELGAADSFDSGESYPVKVDVVIDSIGPATWDHVVAALKPGGRLVTCGGTSGQTVELSLPRLFFKQHEIIGSTLGSQEEFAYVTGLMAEGLPVIVDEVLEWDEYPSGVERIRRGDQLGKIVLRHGEAPR